jgi:hypothetical protein
MQNNLFAGITGTLLLGAGFSHAAIATQYTFEDGTLQGTASVADGTLTLAGTGSGTSWVAIPAGTFGSAYGANTPGVTLAVFAQATINQNWAVLWSFGEGLGGPGSDYLQTIAQNGANSFLRSSVHAGDGLEEFTISDEILDAPAIAAASAAGPVPEPSSSLLVALSGLGLLARRRR